MDMILKAIGGLLMLIGVILPIYIAAKSPEKRRSDNFIVFIVADALSIGLVYMLFIYEDSPLAGMLTNS